MGNFKSQAWLDKKASQTHHMQGRKKMTKNLKQIVAGEPQDKIGSYNSVDVGFSVKKPHKYCDFVGFHAKYQDPKTGLRYYNNEFYPLISSMTDGQRDQYLSIRKANIILK